LVYSGPEVHKQLRMVARLFALLVLLAPLGSAATKPAMIESITWTPETIASGSPCLFKVNVAAPVVTMAGTWQGHPITLFPGEDNRTWYALAGVDVEAKPGSYKIELKATTSDGRTETTERDVSVSTASYKTEVLRVPQKYVKPDAETLVRIDADKQLKKAAFAHEVVPTEWSGRFDPPTDTKPSEGFGTRRTFNGQLASVHRGMDYHAAEGTPVMAANSGEVVLARELFYEGNCVMINHGQQFLTIYMHLSHLSVKEGDRVKKGQEIGLSGATGRATGPHLHVAVRWQDAYLDPAQLWTLPLPRLLQEKESAASVK
jgi:murein DD-endopeptidase MepM/ murein hydrolase activator NlpD